MPWFYHTRFRIQQMPSLQSSKSAQLSSKPGTGKLTSELELLKILIDYNWNCHAWNKEGGRIGRMEDIMEGSEMYGKRRKSETAVLETRLLPCSSRKKSEMKCQLQEYFCGDVSNGRIKNKTSVIFDNGKGEVEELSYWQLNHGAEVVRNVLAGILEEDGSIQEFIGVKCCLGRLYPVLVLGILQSGSAFYNLDPSNLEASLENGIKFLRMKYILSSSDWNGSAETLKVKDISIFGSNLSLVFRLHKVASTPEKKELINGKFAYAIQTSGTTGGKKTVLVPHNCICPNIEDFAKIHWNLTENDIIFGSAPQTFDPHVVELFSALAVGATIIYTTPAVKINGNWLAKLLTRHKVSILPATPTLFRRLVASISVACLSMNHLRVVTLGGEKCPDKKELREAVRYFPNSKLTFQNVYGVTEVSCWASLSNINLDSNEDITIGNGLLETTVWLDGELEGEIVITSTTRHCAIINPSSITPQMISTFNQYRTGDKGSRTLNGIKFEGREDRVVKRNGMKVSLYQIEKATISTNLVSFAACNFVEGKIYLVVTMTAEHDHTCAPSALYSKLELPLFMYPDFVITIKADRIPLNGNGKLDWNSIIKSFHSSTCTADFSPVSISKQQVICALTSIWKSCTNSGFQNGGFQQQVTFTAAGGTSISATRFIESSFMALSLFGSEVHQRWESRLLTCLLDESSGTFEEIVKLFFEIVTSSPKIIKTSSGDMEVLPEIQEPLPPYMDMLNFSQSFEFSLMVDDDSLNIFNPVADELSSDTAPNFRLPPDLDKTYKFPLGLCVDASPVLVPYKNQAIIGCHGGIVICVDLRVLRTNDSNPSKAIAWTRKFPNRIEATVEVHPSTLAAYVGCHNGNFYKLSVVTGETESWVHVGNPIRSKCAIYNDLVIFADSDNSIYCVDANVLNMIWHVKSFKLLATICPVIFRGRCIIPTLDNGIVCLDCVFGFALWNTSDEYSNGLVYSSPLIICGKRKMNKQNATMFVCTSNIGIEARDPKTGILKWFHKSDTACIRIHQPLFSVCSNYIIWLENVSSDCTDVSIISADDGRIIGKSTVPHIGPMTPCLLDFKRKHQKETNQLHEKMCYLFFKGSRVTKEGKSLPQLQFLPLYEIVTETLAKPGAKFLGFSKDMSFIRDNYSTSGTQENVNSAKDFETFSKPVVCGEFILFGGRDNNLHVMKLKK